MSRTIGNTLSTGITLSPSDNPLTITGTGRITASDTYAIFAEATLAAGWTVSNFGTVVETGSNAAVRLQSYVHPDSFTNQSGGLITSTYTGVQIDNGGVVINAANATISSTSSNSYASAIALLDTGTVVNSGLLRASYLAIYEETGGSVTNFSTGTISGGGGVYLKAPGTVTNAGTIIGTNARYGAVDFDSNAASNRLIVDPGAVFSGKIISLANSTNVIELASGSSAGTLSGFDGSGITNFATLQFDTGADWTVTGNTAANGLGSIAITGFTTADTIDLTGFVAVSKTFANNTLVLSSASNAHATLHIQGSFSSGSFALTGDGSTGTDVVVCFAAGTYIGTPTGEVPVEQLQIGEPVLTAHNGPRAVTWIGRGKVLATRGRRTAATPVIVRKGALADNVPNRDLHVTKAHSLYIDDVLIPVEFLVNHRTILWDDHSQEVALYHIELETHDVLIANGAPAESYRDDGNRWLFQNSNTGWGLPPQEPCAPVLTGGPVVDAAWRRLLDRAGPRALPPLTDDPDLHLLVDGTRVDAEERQRSVYVFRLPSNPKRVVIASREIVPAEFGIARDPRSLGVALRQLAVRQGVEFIVLDADDERLTAGFHAYEPSDNLRWTDGYAELPSAAFARFDKGAELTLHLGGATQYPDEQARPARAAA
jgi:antigen 43